MDSFTIGIYGLASQSGMAYFADLTNRGYKVIGYNRPSEHGTNIIKSITDANGITLERPQNSNNEASKFIPLDKNIVTTDISILTHNADIIIIALPSIYHEEAAHKLCIAGIWKKRTPLILSPSRTFATPYLWEILGNRYPIICFSTCPYSCKRPNNSTALIKRRKRTWMASLEGDISDKYINIITELFPQAALTKIPALTSLNNIGAVFHCATYLLNIDEIQRRESTGEVFSFYMDGIANKPEIGTILEQIDQIRLAIANKIGIGVFGLKEKPREDIWRKLTNGLRALEAEHEDEIDILRRIRNLFMQYINDCVLSAQCWLDITYGVYRIENEPLSDAIKRTPTYQKNSVPQLRYIEEDIPTGLVPLESIAKRLKIDCQIISDIIDKYNLIFNTDIRIKGRNLESFSNDYIISYLKGTL